MARAIKDPVAVSARVERKERRAFQLICLEAGVSVESVIRGMVRTAIKQNTITPDNHKEADNAA